MQRPYSYRGAEYYRRSYYVNGVAYNRYYRPYYWGGVPMAVYAPGFYYAPAFYGWAYYPWAAPVPYAWGWGGNPWYGYYGGWFTPYPVYASPALWLTDYLVAQTLQAAYQDRSAEMANAQANNFAATPLTPEVKQQIADEVHRQLALESAEAQAGPQASPDPGSSGIARMLSDTTSHIFVVSAPLSLQSSTGDCPVTEGDVLQLDPGTPPNAPAANLMVLATKGQDCPKGTLVTVGVADLQDMQNHMRETIDQGLGELQKKQGQNGIPAAPAGATAPPVPTAYAAIAPPPDPNLQAELSQDAKDGAQAENQALAEAASPGGPGPNAAPDTGAIANTGAVASAPNTAPVPVSVPAAPTKELALGMTTADVEGLLGQPKSRAVIGTKKIYVYDSYKITFVNDKVTDIK
jgi:hypothetical protein